MIRDVFYFNKKPNVHPREKHARDLAHARSQSTTEHFWIINEFCEYKNFDWDWDFEFLHDEDVWAEEHNNVWPSFHQKDSGTWLCSTEFSDVIVYRADVDPIARKNEQSEFWNIIQEIDKTKFDFSWHPDVGPAFNYVWGNKWHPVELEPVIEYHVAGATEIKYMTDVVEVLPQTSRWINVQEIDKSKFDLTWRPDPREPPYIYVWGNKFNPVELETALEYHCPGATEIKYMSDVVEILPQVERWAEIQPVDKSSFDFTWRPDPREPPFIYVWGNKFNPVELETALEYHCPGATEIKYMTNVVEILPQVERWVEIQPVDKSSFDFSWRPDPREPPYIYVWGNKFNPVELETALEYHCPGATEIKYMTDVVEILPQVERWVEIQPVDKSSFDFTWRPDPREPPFIYVWGNKWNPVELETALEYHCPGATEIKYMTDVVEVLGDMRSWVKIQEIDQNKFDLTWRPDPREPPFIYVWGNKFNPVELETALEYHCPGATEIKYMTDVVEVLPETDRWSEVQPVDKSSFDFTWRPDPREPPYIYQFGTQHQKTGGPRYTVPGATDVKYIATLKAVALPDKTNWTIPDNIDVTAFDFSWHPDDTSSENYIYCFSTQWALSGGPRYSEPGALQKKYIETITSIALPSKENWEIPDNIDADTFDFSWHPYTEDDPYIYQFGTQHQKTGGPRYITPGVDENSAIKYIDTRIIKATAVPQNKSPNWVLIDDMIVQDFDFSWHPDDTDDAYIHVFGNQWNPAEVEPTIEYHVQGSTQRKYVNSQIVVLKGDPERFTNTEFIIEFDYSWRPNPKDTEYIHQFGTQWGISGGPRLAAADATEIKYVEYPVSKIKVNKANWVIPSNISTSDFDFSWHPHVEDKPYIYQFGTQWAKTGGPAYIVPGATEVKYIDILKAEMLPNISLWVVPSNLAKDSFDFSWHPDSTDAPFIYQFSTQWALSGGPKLIVGNATEVKYVEYPISRVIPSKEHWTIPDSIDADSFDFSWHPYVEDQPYIYQFGTQWQKTGGPVYNTPGADGISSVKYIDTRIIRSTRLASKKNFTILNNYIIKEFDYSWHPDATDEPYIYQFGNNLYPAEIMPTIEYIVPGATQIKYVNDIIAILDEDKLNWEIPDNIDSHQFDFSWKPNPNDPPYIYQFGTQWQKTGGPRYVVESAIEIKFVDTHIMKAVALANKTLNWVPIIALSDFDYSWYPDATEDPYIYVFGNQWNPAELEPTVEYHVLGATERKYISDIIATSAPYTAGWETITEVADFDYSWRPNPTSPPYVYVFGNTQFPGTIMPTIKLRIGDATQEKFIDTITAKLAQKPELFENTITPGFDYSWRPDPTSPPYIYQFGTILDENDGPRFVVPGNTGEIVNLERTITSEVSIPKYYITTTLEDLAAEHTNELFWALNSEIDYTTFDFTWRPNIEKAKYVHAFGSRESVATQTYFVNGAVWHSGFRDINYLEDGVALTDDYLFKLFKKIDMFFVDKGNAESADRFAQLKIRFPSIQKTRYLNSWVDTINRCINRVTTNLCWILNSELDYSDFDFDYYPSPWQMSLVHVFGTQWSHWGTTFMVNKNSFAEDTKYVKIIEHLSNLNFVKRKVAAATNCLYDAVVVDHGNEATADIVLSIQSKITKTVSTIKYTDSYLNTFKELLKTLPEKKEHYIWVCSSICDYSSFDFSYICDPFAKEQLHVFPSDKQKFGDTFLVDVNKLRLLVTDMTILEDYKKINYNQHQRVKRLLAPQIITNDDTHVSSAKADFKFPYAVLTTYDNVGLSVVDAEPMSLWAPEHKNIIITSVGGTRIIVPAEAKQYVTKELYDYPYIVSNPRLGKSASMDIIFLSNGEASADTNYDHLLKMTKGLPNRVVRVDGVAGRVNSQQAAATASNTPWYFLVNGKLQVNQKFDWNWQPDRLQVSKHYIFTATNPVNRLEYGHQAIVANNKKLTMNTIVSGLDFTMDSEHEVVNVNCGVAMFNSSEWDTWRTAFREAIKLRASDSAESADRLNTWLTVGTGNFSEYSLQGAKHAVEYYDEVSGDMDKLKLSYDWPWLRSRFDSIYPM